MIAGVDAPLAAWLADAAAANAGTDPHNNMKVRHSAALLRCRDEYTCHSWRMKPGHDEVAILKRSAWIGILYA
jgi:hypothetical protein